MFCKVGPRFWYRCWIILLFLFGGTVVTLTAKWANLIKAKGNSGEAMEFRHSFIQVRKMVFYLTYKFKIFDVRIKLSLLYLYFVIYAFDSLTS